MSRYATAPLTPAEQFFPKVFYGPRNVTFEISTFSISREIRKTNPAGYRTVKLYYLLYQIITK
jgi:hypothetical protein